jgi:glycosyltransferase involved in cell wall biosynthesis
LAREAPDLSVELLSLIVTPEPTTTPFAERRGIVFIANFQHPPNCDALEDYLQNVHPLVRQRLPDVLLTVIGPHVPPHLQRLGEGSVEFTGSVPDIRPRFASARLSVAPLRYGAGIKGKVCTSLAFGVPAVTTTIGAEGMDLTNGNDILIADDPQAFADGVVALHSDERLWSRLAQAGPASIGAQFSPDHARRTLARVLGVPVPDAPRNAGVIQPE